MPRHHALAVLFLGLLALPAPARADDFPSDVKRTFQTDIPHFFQDDIPCAFGGQPTSGARTSCKGDSHPAATTHKATTHKKKKRVAAKQSTHQPATNASAPDQAGAGADAGGTAGTPAAPSAAGR